MRLLTAALRLRGISVEIVKVGAGGEPADRAAAAASAPRQAKPEGSA